MPLLDPDRRWAGGMASARPEVAMEPAFFGESFVYHGLLGGGIGNVASDEGLLMCNFGAKLMFP